MCLFFRQALAGDIQMKLWRGAAKPHSGKGAEEDDDITGAKLVLRRLEKRSNWSRGLGMFIFLVFETFLVLKKSKKITLRTTLLEMEKRGGVGAPFASRPPQGPSRAGLPRAVTFQPPQQRHQGYRRQQPLA